jgi:hypothetical protein
MSTITIPDLERCAAAGPVAYYAGPDGSPGGTRVLVIRCGNEFGITVFQGSLELRAFDYLPRGAVPDGPLDAATVTRLAREAMGNPA